MEKWYFNPKGSAGYCNQHFCKAFMLCVPLQALLKWKAESMAE